MVAEETDTITELYSDLHGARLLLVDDEIDMHYIVGSIAEDTGLSIECVASRGEMERVTSQREFDIALVDMVLPDAGGVEIISYLRNRFPLLPLVVITGHADQDMVYQLECAGILHVLIKPFTASQLRFTLCKELVRCKTLASEGVLMPAPADVCLGLVGNSDYIKTLREKIELFAHSDLPVLVQGPTGTGKEIIAGAIHRTSARGIKTMMTINSAAIPEHLEEAEFFGHTRGAFTGAQEDKYGIIECANGSTLFLDEVGELSLRMQAKLLRVLDGYGYMRVGDSKERHSDFRLISATNRPLVDMIQHGLFREDLYFRIKSGVVETLPLVKHREDIPLLVRNYLYEVGHRKKTEFMITGKAMGQLLAYHWPGNIRELKNVVESLCVINRKTRTITAESIGWAITGMTQDAIDDTGFSSAKAEFEKKYYISLLTRHNGNISASAQEAHIDRPNFSKKLRAMGIIAAEYRSSSYRQE